MIPEGWKTISIEDSHIDIIDGDRGKNYPKQEEFSPEGFCLFLNASNVTKAGFNFDNCQFVPKERDRLLRKGKLERNDLVLTTRGTVGNVAFFDSSVPFEVLRINSGMVILRNKDPHIDNRFVYLVLGSDLFQNQVKRIAFGSAQPQLTVGTIKKLKIPLPPLPEQCAIAAILGTWDRAIALTERRLTAAEQRKKALMQQLLTGRVRFPEFAGEEWRETHVEDVAQVIMGQSPSSENYNNENIGLPLVQGNADIKNRKTAPRVYTSEITKECKPGDVILSVRAPVGDIALSIHKACIGRGVCAICARKVDASFLYQLFISLEPKWDRYAQGSTFTAINSKDIKLFRVKIPSSVEEQRRIAAVLNACDRELDLLRRKRDALQQQKKGLMQRLLTGRVRVAGMAQMAQG